VVLSSVVDMPLGAREQENEGRLVCVCVCVCVCGRVYIYILIYISIYLYLYIYGGLVERGRHAAGNERQKRMNPTYHSGGVW